MNRLWLIRHSDQTFSRPIPEPVLIAKIEAGDIDRKDEVCCSTEYWISVQDVEEMRKFFGDINLEALLSAPTGGTSTTLSGDVQKGTKTLEPMKQVPKKPKTKPMTIRLQSSPVLHPREALPADNRVDDSLLELKLPDEEVRPLSQRALFVIFLVLIFFGTVYFLWIGSQD